MPAFSTHYIFANSLIKDIRAADPQLHLCVPAVYYGTQGPDFLFAHRILPTMKGKSLKELGSQLHHCDPSRLFYYMGEYLRRENCDKSIVKSYIYGFICHFSLDRTTHPYVYAIQKKMTAIYGYEKFPTLVMHNKIELNIDMLLLRDFLKTEDTRSFRTDSTLSGNERLIDELGRLMAYVVPLVNGNASSASDYSTGYRDMKTVQRFLTDDRGWLNPAAAILQLPIKPFMGPIATSFLRHKRPDMQWDYLNLAKQPWVIPAQPEKTSTQSFHELFALAQKDAINIISSFDDAMDGRADFDTLTGNMSFDTGARFDVPVELY